ncbi:hypothetical protein CEXT_609851 [Caerostris extrusa]|uniref:Uncharacterized protein n=1 Tax=Caerostris extrusa TaxID=172846 RepID=A0AAV4NVW8_CAEEX|nr:hypothetical protein CEXT_609851 [Caerostris extrusa]
MSSRPSETKIYPNYPRFPDPYLNKANGRTLFPWRGTQEKSVVLSDFLFRFTLKTNRISLQHNLRPRTGKKKGPYLKKANGRTLFPRGEHKKISGPVRFPVPFHSKDQSDFSPTQSSSSDGKEKVIWRSIVVLLQFPCQAEFGFSERNRTNTRAIVLLLTLVIIKYVYNSR